MEKHMSRIVHLAVKVDDLEEATRFYTEVFGFTEVKTGRNRQHISRHMTDGHIDFTLMKYDSEDAHEAQLAGAGPRLPMARRSPGPGTTSTPGTERRSVASLPWRPASFSRARFRCCGLRPQRG
jgi:catechol 2,3-dioxygenase-like lactoylglutathione lyase family enzyme